MKKNFFIPLLTIIALTGMGGPHLGFLYPSGGKAGECVQILVGGSRLFGIDCVVSGGGVTAQSIEIIRNLPNPVSPQQKFLRQWINGVLKNNPKMPKKPADTSLWRYHHFYESVDQLTPLQMEVLVNFLVLPRSPLQMSPAISQRAIITLRIDQNATPGRRELRLISRGYISNPLPFYIGNSTEYRETPLAMPPNKRPENVIALPGVVNGQILPGEIDKFTFFVQENRTYTFTLRGRELVPFMGDCVPGNFQPVIEILDNHGKSVAYADDYYFNPDPRLTFKFPRSGRYTLIVRDALYRGRADFIYRIEICEGLKKFQLPLPPVYPMPEAGISSRNTQLTLPVLVHGVIDTPRQCDCYQLKLREGETIVAEIWARRLGSPLDSNLTIANSHGVPLAFNDDYKNFGFNPPPLSLKAGENYPKTVNPFNVFLVGTTLHQADSKLIFTAPKDDTYTIKVADSTSLAGDDYRYFLRLDRPRPSFRVYYTPSGIEASYLRVIPIRVVVERIDGFNEEIALDGLPNYYAWAGTNVIPKGVNYAWLTISAKPGGRKPSTPIKLNLNAGFEKMVVTAIPCDEAMQAFAYTHLIPAQQGWITRNWRGRALTFKWDNDKIVGITPGAKGTLILKKPPKYPVGSKMVFAIADPLLPLEITSAVEEDTAWKINISAKETAGIFNVPIKYTHTYQTLATKKTPAKNIKDEQFLPIRRIEVKSK